jgi:hypothetical protein
MRKSYKLGKKYKHQAGDIASRDEIIPNPFILHSVCYYITPLK